MQPPHERPDLPRLIPVIVGAAAAIVAIIVLWVVISVRRDQPFPVDVWWHDLMVDNRTDAGLVLAWIPGHLGGPVLAAATGLVVVAVLLILRWWWAALTVATALVLCIAIAAPLARVVARIRPEDSLAEEVHTSYPSGHVAFATALVTVLALLFRHWIWWAVGAVWAIWMAWSRTYLAAHWLTDVIGGLFLGVAVGILSWAIVETIRRRRASTSEESQPA
ncbi:phosphatase PAP2 family protein [Microbacterium sp. CFBP9034]|uniref:phosphatase PAP2 family protein n=1 Tax=Microbacterium sp. CFBP9034 TaxID=3096540 RepID=UPI002A6B1296|nr:phosphatase PAP2 family protein [Microbacterium sp. CFBP9034]MDY0908775.1 phosphatase PAP2 family protein [Microbacterium sp. CFBP9034]